MTARPAECPPLSPLPCVSTTLDAPVSTRKDTPAPLTLPSASKCPLEDLPMETRSAPSAPNAVCGREGISPAVTRLAMFCSSNRY